MLGTPARVGSICVGERKKVEKKDGLMETVRLRTAGSYGKGLKIYHGDSMQRKRQYVSHTENLPGG